MGVGVLMSLCTRKWKVERRLGIYYWIIDVSKTG